MKMSMHHNGKDALLTRGRLLLTCASGEGEWESAAHGPHRPGSAREPQLVALQVSNSE